ncbi:MAG: alpha/beta hydrolase [Actinobacteria bacterium]|nr:alpha/beta hydrolase [Actinomycetota bacterium]
MTARYVDIGGHPTWVDQRGTGQAPVLLLHGGLSDGEILLDGWEASLGATHSLTAFDRRGHGRTADTEAAFHYDDMATETIAVLESVVGTPAHLVGWSDGGIVAIAVAMRRPDLVQRLVLIGTNFHHDGALPVDLGDDPGLALIVSRYAALSPDGGEHFSVVAGKFMQMSTTEPTWTTDDIATVQAATLVLVGDDDLIALEHTCTLYQALPQGQLAVVPGASHTVPIERADETAAIIDRFLTAELPPTTMMAVRRR